MKKQLKWYNVKFMGNNTHAPDNAPHAIKAYSMADARRIIENGFKEDGMDCTIKDWNITYSRLVKEA